jgi:hypothetical protein
MCMPQMIFEKPQYTFDCCVRCTRQIPSAFQISHPGTDVCDYCAVVKVDHDEEERQS